MRTEVTLVSHKAHTQQAILALLMVLAERGVCCRQVSMLAPREKSGQRPYLAVVVSVPQEENPWLANVIEGGLDSLLSTLAC